MCIRDRHKGKYLLVIEGAIPTKDGGIYCKIGGKTAIELAKECAADAAAVIAIGSCASWGGMPVSYTHLRWSTQSIFRTQPPPTAIFGSFSRSTAPR